MTIQDLVDLLEMYPENYEVYVNSPKGDDDYFVDRITADYKKEQVFIETAQ